jgi:hypothetical protein
MRKSLSIFSTAALVILSLLVTACPVAYRTLSPATLSIQTETLTGQNNGGVIKEVDGTTTADAQYSHTINIASAASAQNIPAADIKSLIIRFSYSGDNWWWQYPAIYAVVDSNPPIVILDAEAGSGANQNKVFTKSVSVTTTGGASSLTIRIGDGDGDTPPTTGVPFIDFKILGVSAVF